jgi:hypothetical protein
MPGCPECPSPVEHEPEECPAAVWYSSGGNGACEAYFLTTRDGRMEMAGLVWGTVAYEQAKIDGTDMMHSVSECRVND